ncbi:8-oxoguanine DNA glycosylase OGG fold protein [Janibacter hoylei]|uniref:8-oxoguanine DNA glycosylase OGG fold protein n=1 Tax=Janibacter hoylei TaxID=364298 RepID=UPI00389ABA7D
MARSGKSGRSEDLEEQARDAIGFLQLTFPDGAPIDNVVRRQGFHWSVGQWGKRWPTGLAQPPQLDEAATKRPFVTRQDVFDRARDVTNESDAIELFLLMAAWPRRTAYHRDAATAPSVPGLRPAPPRLAGPRGAPVRYMPAVSHTCHHSATVAITAPPSNSR